MQNPRLTLAASACAGLCSLVWPLLVVAPVFGAPGETTPGPVSRAPANTGTVPAPAQAPEGMVLVPAGPFLMGTGNSDGMFGGDAMPRRRVTLPAFYIDRTEVTNAQYKKYCDATNYPPPPHWVGGVLADVEANVPVTHVSWWEAQAYAKWAGKRLPSEAEWEKAARGTDGREYPWGGGWSSENVVGNADKPQPVGSRPGGASPYGALDMAGNAFEWVADWYAAYPGAASNLPQYGTAYKVARGGGFSGASFLSKTYYRSVMRPGSRSEWIGFRCAQSAAVQSTSMPSAPSQPTPARATPADAKP